jgi:WD40 repeat protein
MVLIIFTTLITLLDGMALQDAASKKLPPPRSLSMKVKGVSCLRVSTDSSIIGVSSTLTGVSLWRLPSGKKLHIVSDNSSTTNTFTGDGKRFAFGEYVYDEAGLKWFGRVTVVDVASGKKLATISDIISSPQELDCDPDSGVFGFLCTKLLQFEPPKQEIVFWDAKANKRSLTMKGRFDYFSFTAERSIFLTLDISNDGFVPNGRIPKECSLYFSQLPSGKEHLRLRSSAVSSLAVSQSRSILATVGYKEDTDVQIRDIVKHKHLGKLPRGAKGSPMMAFGLDDKVLACAEPDQTVVFWDLNKTKLIGIVKDAKYFSEKNPIRGLVFTPDGKLLITATEDGVVNFWEVKAYLEKRLRGT